MAWLLIHARTGKTYITEKERFNTEFGLVDVREGVVKSSTGEEFLVTRPYFLDLWQRIKRGPQVTHWKDLGLIVALTGLGSGWRVLDAGGGSGFSALFFANIVGEKGKVFVYERNPKFFRLVRENVERLGLGNVVLKEGDVYEGVEERDLDLVFLDLPEPWRAFPHVVPALKPGGFLVCYLPTMEQVMQARAERPDSLMPFSIYETLVRRWKQDVTRPENTGLLHTAFVLVSRRVK